MPLTSTSIPAPKIHHLDANGIRLCAYEWHAGKKQDKPALLLLHATGFHGRIWDEIVSLLPERPIFAWDMRGHGGSDKTGPYAWENIYLDLEALISGLQLENILCIGHSMGGWCAAMGAIKKPEAFRELLLIDPIIMAPERFEQGDQLNLSDPSAHPVAKRRNLWPSWQAMVERFKNRLPFSRWTEATLIAYCQNGLLPTAEGGWMLACPPLVEASFYMNAGGSMAVHDKLGQIQIPTQILRAPQSPRLDIMDFSNSSTWIELANKLPNSRDALLPELTHFMPMEAPEVIAEYIQAMDGF